MVSVEDDNSLDRSMNATAFWQLFFPHFYIHSLQLERQSSESLMLN